MTVSRLAHNALQRIQHPIHAEHRAPFAGYNRMPPAEQQGPVIADPNILPNAVQPEALDTHQIANRKNAPKPLISTCMAKMLNYLNTLKSVMTILFQYVKKVMTYIEN